MRSALIFSCLALLALMTPAHAELELVQVGAVLRDQPGDALAIEVAKIDKNNAVKGAAIIVIDAGVEKDSDYGKQRVLAFGDKEAWRQLRLLWEKTRAAPKAVGTVSQEIGDYKDSGDNMYVRFSMGQDGNILLTVEEIQDAKGFTFFFLDQKSFAEFSDDVEKVSDYFEK